MSKEKMIQGNMDPDYELKETEINYYHIRCVNKTHDSEKYEYELIPKVIKAHYAVYRKMKRIGHFNQYTSTEILHDPTQVDKEPSTGDGKLIPSDELKADYLLVLDEEVPEGMEETEVKAEIKDKSEEIKDSVRAKYNEVMGESPKNKGVVTMLRNIEEAQAAE